MAVVSSFNKGNFQGRPILLHDAEGMLSQDGKVCVNLQGGSLESKFGFIVLNLEE